MHMNEEVSANERLRSSQQHGQQQQQQQSKEEERRDDSTSKTPAMSRTNSIGGSIFQSTANAISPPEEPKPLSRKRPSGSIREGYESDAGGDGDGNPESGGLEEEGEDVRKVEARRAYNRQCAARARKRNKDLIASLQQQVKDLERDKASLERTIEVQRAQMDLLEQQNRSMILNQQHHQQQQAHYTGTASHHAYHYGIPPNAPASQHPHHHQFGYAGYPPPYHQGSVSQPSRASLHHHTIPAPPQVQHQMQLPAGVMAQQSPNPSLQSGTQGTRVQSVVGPAYQYTSPPSYAIPPPSSNYFSPDNYPASIQPPAPLPQRAAYPTQTQAAEAEHLDDSRNVPPEEKRDQWI